MSEGEEFVEECQMRTSQDILLRLVCSLDDPETELQEGDLQVRDEHLPHCAPCRKFYEDIRRIQERLGRVRARDQSRRKHPKPKSASQPRVASDLGRGCAQDEYCRCPQCMNGY